MDKILSFIKTSCRLLLFVRLVILLPSCKRAKYRSYWIHVYLYCWLNCASFVASNLELHFHFAIILSVRVMSHQIQSNSHHLVGSWCFRHLGGSIYRRYNLFEIGTGWCFRLKQFEFSSRVLARLLQEHRLV